MNKPIHKFTKKLKQYRQDRDWTQSQMCDYIELQTGIRVSRSMLHKLENGERSVKAEAALEISKATRIPVPELVFQDA